MSTAAASSANANIPPTGGNAAGNANFQPAPANTFGAIKQRVLWIGFAMLGRYAISEYGEWKSFGTGSIEPSIKEYAKMNLLRIQVIVLALLVLLVPGRLAGYEKTGRSSIRSRRFHPLLLMPCMFVL